ncbi:uncharacterized protein LOC132914975 [Bombus pascuorum]|uniref:uncharacterized protein LOC132914975 n=1 Tax=Bombus pascuorum TaxID=65598 RepID=UPI00298E99FD|nr:uncharacterized protein LOC132914975 [Bombus pascuorum]XP_060830530.1 uncharacterized protein LOC132914975 [Bombus pascuorum]
MDPLLSSTSKKYRKEASINIPIIECKREFTLPHKFPSTVNSSKCSSIFKDHEASAITNAELQSNLSGIKNIKTLSTNAIQKLRIQTQDGKDLGEVKVKILNQKNLPSVPKITKVQQGRYYVKNSGTTSSVISQNDISALLKPLEPQLHAEVQKSTTRSPCCTKSHTQFVVKPLSSSELLASIKCKVPVTQSKKVVQKHYVLAKVNKVDQSNKLLLLNENGHNIFQNIPGVPEKNTEPGKNNIVLVNKQKNAEECIFKNNEKSKGNENNDVSRKTDISNNRSSIIQLAKSKFPVVRCEKLKISPTRVNTNKITVSCEKAKKRKHSNLDGQNHPVKKIIVSNINSCSPNSSEIQKFTSVLKKPANFIPKILDNNKSDDDKDDVMILCEKNTIIGECYNNTQEKNCTSALVNNKNVDKKTQGIFTEIGNKPKFCKNKSQNKIRAEETEDNEENGKLSECLNVIKEALISVKDDQLRAKALHALAECGIGIAKQVPIIPPEILRTVHDSQIQTDVFGLLDSESFVLVKENIPTVERIKQIERSTVNLSPVMQEVYTQTERQIQCKSNFNNNINDIDLFPMCKQDTIPLQNTVDFDNCFNELFNNNTDVNRVKEVLSTPHSLCKKVARQIERDYDEMQHYDDNGMLNIHRAVVNDQLHDVQRLLLILEASKTSIDVLTEDGRTSLELAIMNEASKDIVKLLLEAGAKPILSELVHDSAVLLACKQSSPFLSYLLSYVTEPELLNREDSTGMAPLHYCALKGNLDGINALVEMGAEINLKDHRSGRTPFFHALENNHMPVAQKLLECGAIADIVNFSGQSVLCLVDETKSHSFKALIKQIVT